MNREAGYTAVEVLLAMTVLTIGSAGVMSMQRGAIQGNLEARKLDVANSIAREWIERLRRDATLWTLPSAPQPGTSNLSNDAMVSANIGTPTGAWFLPTVPSSYTGTPPAEGQSPAFDILGRDLAAQNGDAAKAAFCVHVKLDTIVTNPTNNAPELLRATVRVFWLKQLDWSTVPTGKTCDLSGGFDVAAYEVAHPGTYHIVYASTALRKNPAQ